MQKTKLVHLLQQLDSRELSRFVDYVHSPFYNKHKEVKQLCTYLSKYALDPKRQHKLDKHKVFKYLYKDQPFNANLLHSIISKSLALLHDYLVIINKEEKQTTHLIEVLAALRQRKQFKDYDAVLRKIERQKIKTYHQVEDRYWEKFVFHSELDEHFVTQGGGSYNASLQLKNDSLDLYFITKKLKIACDMLNRNRLIGSDYQYQLVDELFIYLNQPDSIYTKELVIKIYMGVFRMLLLGSEGDEEYFKTKELLEASEDIFSKLELKAIYDYLENHCILQYKRTASNDYLHEMLQISSYLVAHKINFVYGHLADADYVNIGSIAIKLGDYDWASDFIERYKGALREEVREGAYAYLSALLHYASKNYKASLRALDNVAFGDWFYYSTAKGIQLRIYYELDESEALYASLNAFRNYLKRNQQLPHAERAMFEHSIRNLRRIYRLKEHKPYWSKAKFKTESERVVRLFEDSPPMAIKGWLEEVLKDLIDHH